MLLKFKNQSDFAKHVWTLITGSAASQLILILFIPILTRLYSPEDFGVLAIYMNVVGVFAAMASGRYEYAIVRPKKYFEALSLVALSTILISFISVLTLMIVTIFSDFISTYMHLKEYQYILYFIPISVFVTAMFLVLTLWNSRQKQFRQTTYGNMSKSTAISLLQVSLSKIDAGLIIGQIIGNIIALFVMGKQFLIDDMKNIKRIKKRYIFLVLKKYSNFVKFSLPQMIVTTLKSNGIVILISIFFGNAVLGFYSLAMRALILPVNVIGNSIAQVYYQKIANMHESHKSVYGFTLQTLRRLTLIATPLFVAIYFMAPPLFEFVFGEKWIVAGQYAQALVPYAYSVFILSAAGSIAAVFDKQKEYLYWGVTEAVFVIGIIIIGEATGLDILLIFYLLSAFMMIYAFGLLYWLLSIIRQEEKMKNIT